MTETTPKTDTTNDTIKKLLCLRCNHSWWPRNGVEPETCPNPKCRSPYWNKPRKNPVEKDREEIKEEALDCGLKEQ